MTKFEPRLTFGIHFERLRPSPFKGRGTCKKSILLDIFQFLAQLVSAEIEVKPLLIACVLAPPDCGGKRVWLQRDVRKGTLVQSSGDEAIQNGE